MTARVHHSRGLLCRAGLIGLLLGAPCVALGAPLDVDTLPAVLAQIHGFRGRIDYAAHRDGAPAASLIAGSLVVRDGSWTLDERSRSFELHAGTGGATIVSGPDTLVVDDVLDTDALSNAWATAVGDVATNGFESGALGVPWKVGGLAIYVDPSGTHITGFSEMGDPADVAYVLEGWSQSGALEVPTRIVRLRRGISDAAFALTGYRITADAPAAGAERTPERASALGSHIREDDIVLSSPPSFADRWVWARAGLLVCVLLACLGTVAWSRRDAVLGALCDRLALDPRGWRRAGVSIFVEPDGTLILDRMRYRVGSAFFNRMAVVQCSALFVRVTAPGVPYAVVLPRRFRPVDLGVRHARQAGFTLIETLLATGLFAAVVLLAIYPALVAVARADAIANERARAVIVAENALADEEALDAYDGGAPRGAATSTVDGMTLTVAVTPGALPGISDLDIRVDTLGGAPLAHVASWLGAPVKAPQNSSGGPPGG